MTLSSQVVHGSLRKTLYGGCIGGLLNGGFAPLLASATGHSQEISNMATNKDNNSDDRTPITFVIPGQRQVARSAGAVRAPSAMPGLAGQVKDSVRVAARRGDGESVRVTAVPGQDVVLLQIAGGPALLLHPTSARDLMLGQSGSTRSAKAESGEVPVRAQLRWRGLEQAAPTRAGGFLGNVLLQAFEVITGLGSDAKDSAADFVASKVVAKVDGQVDAGVYALQRESLSALKGSPHKLNQVPPAAKPDSEPLLVLIHGTFVDTASTFGKLWALHPQRVGELFAHYGSRVYGLDHPTVGATPISNALTLVNALPAGARLHLATHSRGGLVAEVLARVAGQQGLLSPDELAFFDGAEHEAHKRELLQLAAAVKAKAVRVDRVVRVACPARGTRTASRSWTAARSRNSARRAICMRRRSTPMSPTSSARQTSSGSRSKGLRPRPRPRLRLRLRLRQRLDQDLGLRPHPPLGPRRSRLCASVSAANPSTASRAALASAPQAA